MFEQTVAPPNEDTRPMLTRIRFIPTRSGQDLQASFSLLHDDGSPTTPSGQKKRTPHGELHFQKSMPNSPLYIVASSS